VAEKCKVCGVGAVTADHADPTCEHCGRPICADCIAEFDEETGRIGCRDCWMTFVRWLKRGLAGFQAGEG